MAGALLTNQFSPYGAPTTDAFPNPFHDVASLSMPTSMRNALYWCEHIFDLDGTYRMAMERVISYFLTEVELRDISEDEKSKWLDFLNRTLNIMKVAQDLLRDRMCYGNSFCSILVPFKRFLGCPKCGANFPLKEIYENRIFAFQWQIPDFIATCPACKTGSGYRGPWRVEDREGDQEKKIKIRRWSPHEIELIHCPVTHDVAYTWRIPEHDKSMIRRGELFHLERVSKSVLTAIHRNQVYRFDEDAIFHMKEPTLGGRLNRGWGIPRIITNYRQIYYVQVLRRQHEAIALDYVIPFRLLTPAPRGGTTSAGGGMAVDPLLMYSGGDFRAQTLAMIRRRRRDPASWQVMPFPVNYQMLGAEANQLAPVELIEQGEASLLNAAGVAVELYKGTLQLQTAPVALRLFESTWRHLIADVNMFFSWAVNQISQILSWEAVDATLKRVTIADDMEKQMAALQLYMSQQLSGNTALAGLGFNWAQEQKQIAEEARQQAEIQSRTQEEMEQAGFAQQVAKGQLPGQAAPPGAEGGAPAGGAPAGGGGAQGGAPPAGQPGMTGPVSQYLQALSPNVPVTPEEMMQLADSLANDLLGLPESIKNSELRKLKQSNSFLHNLVRGHMDQKRRDVRSQAGNQAVAQMQQPQPSGAQGAPP